MTIFWTIFAQVLLLSGMSFCARVAAIWRVGLFWKVPTVEGYIPPAWHNFWSWWWGGESGDLGVNCLQNDLARECCKLGFVWPSPGMMMTIDEVDVEDMMIDEAYVEDMKCYTAACRNSQYHQRLFMRGVKWSLYALPCKKGSLFNAVADTFKEP